MEVYLLKGFAISILITNPERENLFLSRRIGVESIGIYNESIGIYNFASSLNISLQYPKRKFKLTLHS